MKISLTLYGVREVDARDAWWCSCFAQDRQGNLRWVNSTGTATNPGEALDEAWRILRGYWVASVPIPTFAEDDAR